MKNHDSFVNFAVIKTVIETEEIEYNAHPIKLPLRWGYRLEIYHKGFFVEGLIES